VERGGADDPGFVTDQIDDAEVAGLADSRAAVDGAAQGLRDRRAGVEKIHVDAARAVVPGRRRLRDAAVAARPADAEAVHLLDAGGRVLAQKLRQRRAAEPTSGGDRIAIVIGPVVRRLRAERDGDRHLRHHGRAATPDQAAVDEHDRRAGARRLDRCIHAGRAGADHQHVGRRLHGLAGHSNFFRRAG
jgi:hypothetical protein